MARVISLMAMITASTAFVAPQPKLLRSGHLAPPRAADTAEEESRAAFDQVVMKTYGRYPITMVKGKGVTLTDSTGKEYLDFVAGIATCCLGHGHPGLIKAVTDQINTVHHVSNLYYIPNQGALAKWLVDNSPMDRVFFCNSGAEANEAAIKLARKYGHMKMGLDEPVIITALSSFHGRTLAAITATGQPKYQKDFDYGGAMVPGFEYVPYNDPEALKAAFKRINEGKRGVAAVLMETLQGEGGIKPGSDEFFKTARELCDETGALLMCDEVQVGMGRTGELWGFQNTPVEPDVFSVAKALGGGVPIGAMLCKEKANVFGPGDHATTYGGNPLACAAGLAVAHAIDEEGLVENAAARGAQLKAGLEALAAQPRFAPLVKDVRGRGLILGLELSSAEGAPTAGEVVGSATAEGLLLVPAGPKVVRFVPPLVVSEKEIDAALEKFETALAKHI